mgnify:CR=1 FL=1
MLTAILAVVLFVILIFPHELGHFIAAKSVGVKVNEFAFGMGPALWKKQKGETLYAIRLFPIGGYCAMEGENEESDNDRAFNNKPGWAKILVLVAGSMMNVIIAVVILSIMMGVIGNPSTTIDKVQAASPAYTAGMEKGDVITAIDGTAIKNWSDISTLIQKNRDGMTVTVNRSGKTVDLRMTPEKSQGRYIVGITPTMNHNPLLAVKNGAVTSWKMLGTMYVSLKELFSGQVSAKNLQGPVGIVTMVHQSESYGLYYFFYLLSFISINLAVINMLPLPALDGGRILFVIIRKITGRMISDKMEANVHAAGMILLLTLMVFVTWNDIGRLFS